ncbi:Conserved_hypothetical protein [Hexamita inflata]|uniref:Integrase catalytic domain-containing protein n=1 Tax=Hexamita inflata TaxID=28002 RepID=A0AA86PBX2_9EUKA|nr:Conserved hypothetical protein [Hexamita inflata]CAI9935970.1 Conserved hypothetical protein [Hexamita inflata]
MTKMVYISQYDDWQLDLIFLKDSKYISKKIPDLIISTYYNPANHRIFVQSILNKTPHQLLNSFISFQNYILKFEDQYIDSITTDSGNEYKGQFQQTLQHLDIQHRVIIKDANDHKSMSHINGVSSFVRNSIINNLLKQQDSIDVQKACDDFMQFHNFERQIPLYKKTPEKISRDDLEVMNEHKSNLNKKHIDASDKFQIGNYVQVINKREDKEKKRLKKWSNQVFQIFDKQGQTFMLTPINFDMKQYKDVLGKTKNDTYRYSDDLPYAQPVFRRKYYEMKITKPNDLYFPFEQEDTRLYKFNKINDCVIDIKQVFHSLKNLQELQDYISKGSKNIFYEIENDYGKFFVPLSMIRYQSNQMTDSELEFWFGSNNKKYILSKEQFKVFKFILYI